MRPFFRPLLLVSMVLLAACGYRLPGQVELPLPKGVTGATLTITGPATQVRPDLVNLLRLRLTKLLRLHHYPPKEGEESVNIQAWMDVPVRDVIAMERSGLAERVQMVIPGRIGLFRGGRQIPPKSGLINGVSAFNEQSDSTQNVMVRRKSEEEAVENLARALADQLNNPF